MTMSLVIPTKLLLHVLGEEEMIGRIEVYRIDDIDEGIERGQDSF